MSRVFKSVKVNINPQWIDWAYRGLSTCYHHEPYGDQLSDEVKRDKIFEVIRRGHESVGYHIHLNVYLKSIPHDVAMQLRTHKHLDCLVTSQRYTGAHLLEGDVDELADSHFYFRSPGKYESRKGLTVIDEINCMDAKTQIIQSILAYREAMNTGVPEEAARCLLAQGIRQSMTFSCNLIAMFNLIKKRTVKDAQFEIRVVMAEIIRQLKETELEPIMIPFLSKYEGKNHQSF